MFWTHGHSGLPGNERADHLAKAGCRQPPPTRPPALSFLARERKDTFRRECKEWWASAAPASYRNLAIQWERSSPCQGGPCRCSYSIALVTATFARTTSTFMFWGCFSYDSKGPCFIWEADETPAEKAEAKKAIEQMNNEREPRLRCEWELTTAGLNRMDLNRPGKKPGKQPVWKFDRRHGKLERDSRGGIDWWRYRPKVLEPLLIPYYKANGLTVQEDGAPSHIKAINQELVFDEGLQRLDWPGNSPDLNPIELAWPQLKRDSQKYQNWEQDGPWLCRCGRDKSWNHIFFCREAKKIWAQSRKKPLFRDMFCTPKGWQSLQDHAQATGFFTHLSPMGFSPRDRDKTLIP